MLSLTLRSTPDAKLPKAARLACVRPDAVSEGFQVCRLPGLPVEGRLGSESHRRANLGAAASSLGASDFAELIRAGRPFQHPEALP